jgi:hypothetical protein
VGHGLLFLWISPEHPAAFYHFLAVNMVCGLCHALRANIFPEYRCGLFRELRGDLGRPTFERFDPVFGYDLDEGLVQGLASVLRLDSNSIGAPGCDPIDLSFHLSCGWASGRNSVSAFLYCCGFCAKAFS